jgi:hypothetical protein
LCDEVGSAYAKVILTGYFCSEFANSELLEITDLGHRIKWKNSGVEWQSAGLWKFWVQILAMSKSISLCPWARHLTIASLSPGV